MSISKSDASYIIASSIKCIYFFSYLNLKYGLLTYGSATLRYPY